MKEFVDGDSTSSLESPANSDHVPKKGIGPPVDWTTLLVDAVNRPGVISAAYSRFRNFSIGNQLLALWECAIRKMEPGPIHTFRGWLELGRHVRKGEKAITLCMPVTVKRKPKPDEVQTGDGAERPPASATFTRFVYRAFWFVICQTEGKEYLPAALPEWNEATALSTLHIERVSFKHLNGNTQGYAVDRQVAVSPIAYLPHKTLFHELAHVILGHCEELNGMTDNELTPINLREVEAESVALICCESLNLPGNDACRGYIQHWLGRDVFPDRSAQRIFKAADQILKSGRPILSDPNSP